MGCAFNNSLQVLTFSPIALDVAAVYDVDIIWVNMCAISFSLVFIPMNFLAIHLYKIWPRHYVLRVGIVIQLTGAWIRYGTTFSGNFWFIFFG